MTDTVHMLRGTPASRLELSFRAMALANEDFLCKGGDRVSSETTKIDPSLKAFSSSPATA